MQNDEGNHLAGGRCPSCQLALKPIYLSPHRRLHRPTDDFRRPCLGLGGYGLHDMQPGFGWNDPAATAFDHDPEGQIAARAAAIQDMENLVEPGVRGHSRSLRWYVAMVESPEWQAIKSERAPVGDSADAAIQGVVWKLAIQRGYAR